MKRSIALLLMLIILLSSAAASARSAYGKHIGVAGEYIVAVQKDGTVKAAGDNTYGQCNTTAWREVVAVSCTFYYVLGLRADGTVYAVGDNEDGQCEVSGWKDITMVVATEDCSFGLKSNGTIIWAGELEEKDKKEIMQWKDIVWIGYRWRNSLFAIDKHGNAYGVDEDFSRLENVVQVQEDALNIVEFLLADGTMNSLAYRAGDVANWKGTRFDDLVEIAYAGSTFMGLKRDGTVISDSVLPYFSEWRDVVEVDGGFGVMSNGAIVMDKAYAKNFTIEQLAKISTWKVMVNPDTIPMPASQTNTP